MYSIALSLFELAKSLGVKFHLNSKVSKIIENNGQILGVEVDGIHTNADYVVCNFTFILFIQSIAGLQETD